MTESEVKKGVSSAVSYYWNARENQKKKQTSGDRADYGARSAVTGGAQLDGFVELFYKAIKSTGIPEDCIFSKKSLELPGFFRPTKEWDLLIIKDKRLIAAIEAKSQVGPSFGNNFNNRTEEAMGSALDLWTAFREGKFNGGQQPFLGYFFMLEDCPKSNSPVKVKEPHFKVFSEFEKASYMKRYELFCRKLVLERHYTSSSFITSKKETGINGDFIEPSEDLSIVSFVKKLKSIVSVFI